MSKLKTELGDQSHVRSGGDLNTQISTFRNKLKDKMEYLDHVETLYSSLVVKENQYRQELHDAREESIKVRFIRPYSGTTNTLSWWVK